MSSQADHQARPGRGLRVAAYFAVLGAGSGSIATTLILVAPSAWNVDVAPWLTLSPGSLLPGLVFGVVIGLALYLRRLASVRAVAFYVVASTLSYLAAFTLAAEVLLDVIGDNIIAIGLIAGLFGSACLTGYSALRFPFARKLRPCLLMLVSGCLLGGLLPLAIDGDGFATTLLFFAVWQAGYAASLATAVAAVPRD